MRTHKWEVHCIFPAPLYLWTLWHYTNAILLLLLLHLAGLHTWHHNGYVDVSSNCSYMGVATHWLDDNWYPQQVPGSPSGAGQPHCWLYLTQFSNSNMKRYRPNACISEPVMAFKVDRRGCLNKHQLSLRGNCWHFGCMSGLSVECISWPWNVTPVAVSLLLMPTALPLLMTRIIWVVRNIDSFEREVLWYWYDAICLQYRDIRYDVMYLVITKFIILKIP